MILFLLLGCPALDVDDCRVIGRPCEVYRPAGTVCGLLHEGTTGNAGASCVDVGRVYDPIVDGACPEGFERMEPMLDDESSQDITGCAALGNATVSSGDVAEVPMGSACGINTVGDAWPTENLCLSLDPTLGACPDHYTLRYALDRVTNCIDDDVGGSVPCEEGESPKPYAHLESWCELTDGGCTGEDCPEGAAMPICGLTAGAFNRADVYREVVLENEPDPALLSALDRELGAGPLPSGLCMGRDPLLDGCPAGLELACLPDKTGEGDAFWWGQGLCWCAPSGTVHTFVGAE